MKNYPYNWKKLNPSYIVKLYDDNNCRRFLKKEYGNCYVDIFNYLDNGAIKADFWRLCILYRFGGIYCDVDNEPLVPLDSFIEEKIDFLICCSFSPKFNYNPNFIISRKNNPIIKKCIDWYIDKYNRKIKFEFWEYSIMTAFNDTLMINNFKKEWGIYFKNNLKIQIIKEYLGKNHYDAHNIYNNIRVFNNRYKDWDCKSRTFIKNNRKPWYHIPKGTNLNYYIFTISDYLKNLFKSNNELDIIIFDNMVTTKKSLLFNLINYNCYSNNNKLQTIYNHIIRSNAKYILVANSPYAIISHPLNLIKLWKEKYDNYKIIFDKTIPIYDKKVNMESKYFLENSCYLAEREALIIFFREALNLIIQKNKTIKINKLIEKFKNCLICDNLFIILNLSGSDNINNYRKLYKLFNTNLSLYFYYIFISSFIIWYIIFLLL